MTLSPDALAEAAPAAIADSKQKSKQSLEEWVYENLEAIIVAIILALVLRYFVMEAFKIPTGSMAPHLLGVHRVVECPVCGYQFAVGAPTEDATGAYKPSEDRYPRATCPLDEEDFKIDEFKVLGGNRILVNKYVYDFRPPKRWEVIVFRYPEDPTKNYIKRCVAMTGEVLDIRNGDVYIDGEIARKPWNVQDSLWLPVYDSNHVAPGTESEFWDARGWKIGRNSFVADDDNGTYRLEFSKTPIYDKYGYARTGGGSVVGDLLFECEFDPQSDGSFEVALGETQVRFVAHFDVSGSTATYTLFKLLDGEAREAVAGPVKTDLLDGMNSLYFTNVDDQARCKLNGAVLGEDYLWTATDDNRYWENGIEVTAVDCMMTLQNVRIRRDIHYRNEQYMSQLRPAMERYNREGRPFYVGFGDHSPASSDSRTFGVIPAENLIGRALVIFWPAQPDFPWLDFKLVR